MHTECVSGTALPKFHDLFIGRKSCSISIPLISIDTAREVQIAAREFKIAYENEQSCENSHSNHKMLAVYYNKNMVM